jgi:hypothetical protein
MTYAELIALVEAEIIDLTDWDDHLPRLMERAQLRIQRDLDLNAARVEEPFVASDEELVLPQELIILQHIRIQNGDYLLQKDKSFLREYWPDASETGTPKFYAYLDDYRLLLAPTPASSTTMELAYTARLPVLSAAIESNWLSEYTPDLLQYSLLLEAAIWTKDVEMQGTYSERYSRALNSVALEYNLRKRTDEYRRGQPVARPQQ